MKTVTDEYLALQDSDARHYEYYRHTFLYRRQWTGAAYELVAALNIDEYVIKIGRITTQQDLILGEWKTGNLKIDVFNDNKQWKRDESGGLWDGYIPEYSEISIEMGYIDSSDVKHGIIVYRGVLTFDSVIEDIEKKTASLKVRGFNEILENKSAEDIADNNITGETLTNVGDDLNYTTANNGVGIFKRVYIDGVPAALGPDYTESQLNDTANPGKVTFGIAQTGKTITADYVYWYQGKAIEYLVEKLVESAGITSHEIQSVIFPSDVEVDWIQDDEAEFDAGTLVNIDTPAGEDTLRMQEESQTSDNANTGKSVGLDVIDAQSFIPQNTGVLSRVAFMTFWAVSGGTVSIRADNGGDPAVGSLESKAFTAPAAYRYVNWKSGWTITLTQGVTYWLVVVIPDPVASMLRYSTGDNYSNGHRARDLAGGGAPNWAHYNTQDLFFAIKYADNTSTSMSDVLDTGVGNPTGWGLLEYSKSALGIFTFYTRSQAADAGWPDPFDVADWVEISESGLILSDVNRYLKVAIVMNYTVAKGDNNIKPLLNAFTVNYTISNITIVLANFTGLSTLAAIRELSGYCDYEFGFKTDKTFFFRQKDLSSIPDIYLNGITGIKSYKIDWARLKNDITATFGNYTTRMNPDTEGDSSPNSFDKYGSLPFNISGGSILGDSDGNISKNIAEIWFERYKAEKYRTRLKCKIFGQLDIGDIAYLTYGILTTLLFWDSLQWDELYWGEEGEQPYGTAPKVIKVSFDPENMRDGGMEVEAVEV